MEDMEIDDILENVSKRKKSVNSGSKGKRGERQLCKKLNTHFAHIFAKHPNWGEFSRSIGSGNRWGQQVKLPQYAKDTYTSDIVVPENFMWCIESKKGYNDIDIISLFNNKCKGLTEMLKQTEEDGKRCGRKPLLIWAKDRKPALAFIRNKDVQVNYISKKTWIPNEFSCELSIRGKTDWTGMLFDRLLETTNDYDWFNNL